MKTIVSFPSRAQNSHEQSAKRITRNTASAAEAKYDAELVRRFNSGDESAFLEIMNRYREKIFAITRALLRSHADAEEITQDTFIRAYRGLAHFRGDSSLATWLHCVAVNLSRNRYWYLFRRRRHATLSLDCPLENDSAATFSDLIATEEPDPARVAAVAEFTGLIQRWMQQLSASQSEILTSRNLLHHSYDTIAKTLGVRVGTVKSRIARARKNMRTRLAEMCPEFAPDAELEEWFETPRCAGAVAREVA